MIMLLCYRSQKFMFTNSNKSTVSSILKNPSSHMYYIIKILKYMNENAANLFLQCFELQGAL